MPNPAEGDANTKWIAWPGIRHLGEAVFLGIGVTLWFWIIYGTADYVTGLRNDRFQVHLESELNIPFVPWLLVFYMSIYPLVWLSPFVVRGRRELRALAASMGLVTLCGGVSFLLIPAELAFPFPEVPSRWAWLYAVADTLNLRYNLAPSLHVGLSILCVDVFATRSGTLGKLLLWTWGGLIMLSTLLTHQHHVLDVVTGFALALAVSRLVYPRWIAPHQQGCMRHE